MGAAEASDGDTMSNMSSAVMPDAMSDLQVWQRAVVLRLDLATARADPITRAPLLPTRSYA